jgi:acylphosphatase
MEQEAESGRAQVVVSGRVQGVSFRYATARVAQQLRVKGWVRNRPDGKVEAVFEGTKTDIESMIAWCHTGPPAASVDNVDVTWQAPTNDFSGFNIRF